MGPLIPLFWTSGDVCPGFQSQGGSFFACFLVCVILRFTSGATPADCTEVGMAAEPFRSTYLEMCPQALVDIQAGDRTHDCLCGENSTVPLGHSGSAESNENLCTHCCHDVCGYF